MLLMFIHSNLPILIFWMPLFLLLYKKHASVNLSALNFVQLLLQRNTIVLHLHKVETIENSIWYLCS